jgi:hypothetical protein
MDEKSILERIGQLVEEEHKLRDAVQSGEITTEVERGRLTRLEEALDQCWDLLRRRRAARESHQDPDAVMPRDIPEVESYLQ